MVNADRRRTIESLLTIGAGSLAGCTQILEEDKPGEEPPGGGTDPTEEPTDNPTETPTEGPTVYSEEEYQQLHQNWMNELLTDLNGRQIISKIERGDEIQIPDWMTYQYPDGGKTFDQQEFLDAGIQEAVNWVGTAIRYHINQAGNGGGISAFNEHIIAYVEKAVDENHPDYQIEGGWITTQGYGNGDSHGVTFFGDQDDNWHHLDTTSSEIVQLNSPEIQESRFYPGGRRADEQGGVYDPLMRFQPGTSDIENIDIDYETKKDTAMDVLVSLGTPVKAAEWLKDMWVQDLALDAVINDHICEGGSVEDVQEPMKKMVYHKHENPEAFVGVYGETVDELTVAYGDSSVYNQAMENPEVIDTQWFEENTTPIPSHQ